MRKPEIETILFDFDGTLMDTNDVIIQSWQHTYRTLRGEEGDIDEILATFGEPLDLSMENLFPDVPLEESLPIYRGYQRENFLSDIKLVDGATDLLDELKDRNYGMALVTSRLKFTTDQALDTFDLRRYFDCVVTADDVTRHKPDPQSVEIALDKLGSSPAKAMMIGDTRHDIMCAKNAGIRSVLVSWSITLRGMGRDDFPPGHAPDHIIDRPEDLVGLLRQE